MRTQVGTHSTRQWYLEVRETMQRIQAPQNMASKTRIIITEPKSASSNRDIPLPRFLMQYAVQFQADRNAFVLTGEKNQFIEPRTLQNRFRNYVKTSGMNTRITMRLDIPLRQGVLNWGLRLRV